MVKKLRLSEEEWRRRLTHEEYRVLRGGGTEAQWEGGFVGTDDPGTYVCAASGNTLIESREQYESGTGRPSFTRPISSEAMAVFAEQSNGMISTEVRCARCDSHRGHVFPDGPPPTGLRYCINSVAMRHVPDGEEIELVGE